MNIALIVSSNSHIDYVARIIDSTDSGVDLPDPSDYCFGQFVALEGDGEEVIGVIYDSRLVNPEYGSFAPRSGPRAELARQNADHVREQGILIGILLLGTIDGSGKTFHGVPPRIVPVGRAVTKIDKKRVAEFHADESGRIQLHYYPQVISNARQFSIPLLGSIIDQLCESASDEEIQRLRVLRQSLQWQGTFGAIKL
jgi:hypothetical protein